jgi:hypothetical protein
MMGTLAKVLAEKDIPTPEHLYWADVEGKIEDVNGILKITTIRVNYHLRVPENKVPDAEDGFSSYITVCPAAQSVVGCIKIEDKLTIER